MNVSGRLSLFGWITRRAGAQTRRSKMDSDASWSFFNEARAFLQGRGLLGAETPEGIAINPEKMFGLRFALTG